jgi:hypothetical protein
VDAVRTGLCLAALLMIGCGSSDKKDTGRPAGDDGAGGGATGGGKGGGAGPLTEADCERLLDHWLALYIAERKKTAKPEEVPTEEDAAKTRQKMASLTPECIGAPRPPYDCSMKAKTLDQARVCLEGGKR